MTARQDGCLPSDIATFFSQNENAYHLYSLPRDQFPTEFSNTAKKSSLV